jgi:curved DNA-binding protein CbpA
MQYNGKFINPYEVLGLPHASDFELVKATYRSLVKIYHPDVFKGDKEFAKERLSQLNAAHEFLSDEQQKHDFDKSPQSQEKGEEQQDFDPEQNSDEFDEGIKILKENWDYACDYYPDLKRLYADLRSLGKEPAFAFMAYVVETKKYKEAATIADQLEDAFLTTKFSNDPKIKKLAKLALQQKEIKFAKELNRALTILGPDSEDDILEQFSIKFPEFAYEAYRSCNLMSMMSPKNPMAKKKADVAELRAKAKEQEQEQEQKDINDLIFAFGGLVILIIVCFAAVSAIYQ